MSNTRTDKTVWPWQQPFAYLYDRLKKAGPESKVKLVIGRKRDYVIIVDRNGMEVHDR